MTATRLRSRAVDKIWGKRHLPPPFESLSSPEGVPIGEIWFEPDAQRVSPLLVKYLFTSEKLSIQVHPDDAAARETGYPTGKDEAWLVLDAEPEAAIGLGFRHRVTAEEVHSAVLDGTIEELVHWQPVQAGDLFYSPAGTVHAIGAGLSLIEVQQNVDVTYRIFDYGRPRELHLQQGLRLADLGPYVPPARQQELGPGRQVAAEGGAFTVERWFGIHSGTLAIQRERPLTLVMVAGTGSVADEAMKPGEVWVADQPVQLRLDESAELLLAYPGSSYVEILLQDGD